MSQAWILHRLGVTVGETPDVSPAGRVAQLGKLFHPAGDDVALRIFGGAAAKTGTVVVGRWDRASPSGAVPKAIELLDIDFTTGTQATATSHPIDGSAISASRYEADTMAVTRAACNYDLLPTADGDAKQKWIVFDHLAGNDLFVWVKTLGSGVVFVDVGLADIGPGLAVNTPGGF